MACSSSTAPINIAKDEIDDDCYLKCFYKYNYPASPATSITNNGNYLSLSYDKVKVNYNNNELITGDIRLYTPSLHTFDGISADAEMVISHMDAGISLLVCIPIVISKEKSDATTKLADIIDVAMKKTPNAGEKSVAQINNFTLNSFIPKKKGFYSYKATLPYAPCNGSHQYIVFTPKDSVVYMSETTIGKLKKMIVAHDSTIKPQGEVFFNKHGAIYVGENVDPTDDDIYIDCHPTGSSGSETVLEPAASGKPIIPINIKNPLVITIIGILAGLLLIFLGTTIFNFIKGRRASGESANGSGASVSTRR